MSDLRRVLEKLGMEEVQTLLQSGNVVFRSKVTSASKLERLLEEATAKELGITTEYFVRSDKEWQTIIEKNPFPKEAKTDPARLVVSAMREAPDRAAVKALQLAIPGREVVETNGRDAYFYFPDGQGRSKVTPALVERHLRSKGTARNWNTVLKIGAMMEAMR
jgi:uncharacterized protein (DUF1697 family)